LKENRSNEKKWKESFLKNEEKIRKKMKKKLKKMKKRKNEKNERILKKRGRKE